MRIEIMNPVSMVTYAFYIQLWLTWPSAADLRSQSGKISQLTRCVVAASKQFFKTAEPIAFHMSVNEYEENFTGLMDFKRMYYSDYTVESTHQHCHGNETIGILHVTKKFEEYLEIGSKKLYQLYPGTVVYNRGDIVDVESEVLQHLHESNSWPILVSSITQETYHSFIIMLKFKDIEAQIDYINAFSIDKRLLVVLLDDIITLRKIRAVFKEFAQMWFRNVVLLAEDSSGGIVRLYSWMPYELPSGRCGFFQDAVLVDTFVNGAFVHGGNLDPKKNVQNLTGCNMTVQIVELLPPVFFAASNSLDGVALRLVDVVAQHMGMQHNKRLSSYGFTEDITVFLMPLTGMTFESDWPITPFFMLSFNFFVPHAKANLRWTSITRVFTWTSWLCVLLSFCIMSLAFWCVSRQRSIGQRFMDTWSAILGIGIGTLPKTGVLRVLFLGWMVYSMSIGTVFQTFMISYFVDPGLQHQVDTIQELNSMNYSLLFDSTLGLHFTTYPTVKPGTSILISDMRQAFIYYVHMPKTALCTSEEAFYHYSVTMCDKGKAPKVHKFSTTLGQIHLGLSLRKQPILQPRFNQLVSWLVQTGFTEKFRRDVHGILVKNVKDLVEYEQLSLEHLQSPILLYSFGFCASLGVFFLEVLFHYIKSKLV